jgi:hypothetical protein
MGWLIAIFFLLMPGRWRAKNRAAEPASAILLRDRANDPPPNASL